MSCQMATDQPGQLETDTKEHCCWLLRLPPELIEAIVANTDSIKPKECTELAALWSSCSYLRHFFATNTGVWRIQFGARYPNCTWRDDLAVLAESGHENPWREMVIRRFTCSRMILDQIKTFSQRYFRRAELSIDDFDVMSAITERFSLAYVVDALNEEPEEIHTHLTLQFYWRRCRKHFAHLQKKAEMKEALSSNDLGVAYTRAWIIFSYLMCPQKEVTEAFVSEQLKGMFDSVVARLKSQLPCHPVSVMSQRELDELPLLYTKDAADSRWNHEDTLAVLDTLNHVLFTQMGFKGNNIDYYDLRNSLIAFVFEFRKGIPISLSLVYMILAGRLGVKLIPMARIPRHFVLCYANKFYIDVFHNGKRVTSAELAALTNQSYNNLVRDRATEPSTPEAVICRMARNVLGAAEGRSISARLHSYDLIYELTRDNNIFFGLTQMYRQLYINQRYSLKILKEILARPENLEDGFLEPALADLQEGLKVDIRRLSEEEARQGRVRTRKLFKEQYGDYAHSTGKFAVGMVMRHRQYDYKCVIYGWDEVCKASRTWIVHMGVHLLTRAENQPFYRVLANDQSERYVAEDNLQLFTEDWSEEEKQDADFTVDHDLVGKYFSSFCSKGYYVPNAELESVFPEDSAIREAFYS